MAKERVRSAAREVPRSGGVGDEAFPFGVVVQPFAQGASLPTLQQEPARCSKCNACAATFASSDISDSTPPTTCALCDAPIARAQGPPVPSAVADLHSDRYKGANSLSNPLVLLLVDENLAARDAGSLHSALTASLSHLPNHYLVCLISFSGYCAHLHRLDSLPSADVFCHADTTPDAPPPGATDDKKDSNRSGACISVSRLDALLECQCVQYACSASSAMPALQAAIETIGSACTPRDSDAPTAANTTNYLATALSVALRVAHHVDSPSRVRVERSRRAIILAGETPVGDSIKMLQYTSNLLVRTRICLDAFMCSSTSEIASLRSFRTAIDDTGGSLWSFSSVSDPMLPQRLGRRIACNKGVPCCVTVSCTHLIRIEQAMCSTVVEDADVDERKLSFNIASQAPEESISIALVAPPGIRKRRKPCIACVQLELEGVIADATPGQDAASYRNGEGARMCTRVVTESMEIGAEALRSPLDAEAGAALLVKSALSDIEPENGKQADRCRSKIAKSVQNAAYFLGESCGEKQGIYLTCSLFRIPYHK